MITCTACRTAVPTWEAYRDPCPAVPHATHTLTAADIAALRPDPDASAIAARTAWLEAGGGESLWIGTVSYDGAAKLYLRDSGHYLQNPPPGCLFAVGVRVCRVVLLPDAPVADGPLLGLCLVGRPVARMLPQDGSVGEVTRLVLSPGLPHGTASRVLRAAADRARKCGIMALIAYHDRTRHTGCIYRKAGFRKDGTTTPKPNGWGTRNRPHSHDVGATPKRRWRLDLAA